MNPIQRAAKLKEEAIEIGVVRKEGKFTKLSHDEVKEYVAKLPEEVEKDTTPKEDKDDTSTPPKEEEKDSPVSTEEDSTE